MINFTMLVRDRFRLTQQALNSLSRFGYGMCVTVLDDRSNNETADFLRYWGAGNGYISRNDCSTGTGRARNTVIETSQKIFGRGDYLYLSDNDVVFGPRWLDTLIMCYISASACGFRIIGGYSHPFNKPIPGEQAVLVGDYEVHPIYALATQSMLMTWETWDKFGPFVETPVDKVCQSEDVAFSNKIREAGYKVGVVSPAVIVSTGITNTFGEKIPGWELVKAQCPEGVICE